MTRFGSVPIRVLCVAVAATVAAAFVARFVHRAAGMNHLRFLRYADEVARAGSIRQAAERLHVAPSAVNRRIQDLEEELGTPLFERLPRGMRLTAAGELFVRYIRGRASELDRVRSEIEDLQGLRRGSVRLVASQALAPRFLPDAVREFGATHPLVGFDARIGDHVQAADALRSFETDLALVFNLAPESDIERMCAVEQKLMAIMHKRHPLAKAKALRLSDCADFPVVLPNRDTGGRQLLERFLARSSTRIRATVESNSFEFLRGCLYDARSISFQMAIGTVADDPDIVARDIEDRGFPRGELVLASLRGRQLPVVAYAFAEFLRKRLAGT